MFKIKIKRSSQLYEAEKSVNKIKTKNLEVLRGRYPSMDPRSPTSEIPHNFIEDLIDQDFRVRYIDVTDDDYEGPQASGNTFVEELVENVPPLKTNRIVQVIAGESFGKIFKLDNDHILKIFVGGVNPDEDMAWYKKCKDLLYSGKARKTTLPVYEAEKITLPSFPGYDVYFAEMAEFIPLDKFLDNTGRSDATGVLKQLKAVFTDAYSKGIKEKDKVFDYLEQFIGLDPIEQAINYLFYYLDLDKKTVTSKKTSDYIKFIYDYLDIDKKKYSTDDSKNIKTIYDHLKIDKSRIHMSPDENRFAPLNTKEAEGIMEAFCDMLWMGFKLSDVATRNMAVLEQDNPSEPTIIIFDR